MKTRKLFPVFLLPVLVVDVSCRPGDPSTEQCWNLMPVVVANRDIPAGTWLDYDLLATQQLPQPYVLPSVIRPSEVEKVVGLRTRFDLQRGDLIQWSWFQPLAEQEANMHTAKLVRRSRRAITLSMAGTEFVTLNDHIDILAALTDPKTGKPTVLTLLHNVIVLGTEWIDAQDGPENRLTLIVLPEEAQSVVLSSQTSTLHAVVRNPKDLGVEEGPKVDLTTVTTQNVLNQLARKRHEQLTNRVPPEVPQKPGKQGSGPYP